MRSVLIVGVFPGWLLACGGVDAQGPCDDDGFGTVTLELQRSPEESSSPFTGTASIVVSMSYDACLLEFYSSEAPNQQFDGVDGGEVKDEWMGGRLCEDECYDKPIVGCTPVEMNQTLNTQPPPEVGVFTVRYEIDSDDIEGGRLPVGPFPTEELASCSPTVSLIGGSVTGLDADGDCLWRMASGEGTAGVGQSASMKIFAESCD